MPRNAGASRLAATDRARQQIDGTGRPRAILFIATQDPRDVLFRGPGDRHGPAVTGSPGVPCQCHSQESKGGIQVPRRIRRRERTALMDPPGRAAGTPEARLGPRGRLTVTTELRRPQAWERRILRSGPRRTSATSSRSRTPSNAGEKRSQATHRWRPAAAAAISIGPGRTEGPDPKPTAPGRAIGGRAFWPPALACR